MGAFTATIQDSSGVVTRRCRVCKEVKTLDGESFHRNKSNKCGFHYDCKVCIRRSKLVRPPVYGPFNHKTCTKCLVSKSLAEGHFSPASPKGPGAFGFKPRCKACVAEAVRKDRAENPDKYRALEQRRRHGGRNKANRDRWATDAKWREKSLAENKEWHRDNAEKKLEYNRRWRKENPDKVREHLANAYSKDKLRHKVSSQVNSSLRKRGTDKGGQSISVLLAYTIDELAGHLERQFTKKMSWDNHGAYWEIDHILPLASFNITSPHCEEFRAAWALTNLRPLEKIENRSKGAKRTLLL